MLQSKPTPLVKKTTASGSPTSPVDGDYLEPPRSGRYNQRVGVDALTTPFEGIDLMPCRSLLLALTLLLVLPLGGRADEKKAPLKEVLALQEAMQQVIEKAEPSIACILVSRSDAYAKIPNAVPVTDIPGKLGKFDAQKYLGGGIGTEDDEKRRKFYVALDLSHPDHQPEAYGSGIVLDESGLILTNAHVVRGATKIYVRLPGNRGSYADIYAGDPRSDLAVLKLIDPVPDLKALKFGDGGKVRKGQFVLTLSNPFAAGFRDGSPSASWGIVSNLRRRAPGPTNETDRGKLTLHHYGTLIQTDTRLTLGCSGGALLNLDGELIGLTTSQAALVGSETPGGFAVPFDDGMKRIVEVLRRGEEVEYGFLGVTMSRDGRSSKGVQIAGIAPGSPAQIARLVPNEYIVSIEGRPVRESDDLFLYIGTQLAGSTITLETARTPDDPRRTVTVKLAKFFVPGSVIASKRPPARAGLRVDWTSLIGQRIRCNIPEGVLIREVVSNSDADVKRLQVDKVITRVNGQLVRTPSEFYAEMAKPGATVVLTVMDADGSNEKKETLTK
jgi:serine protease Do